MNLDWLMQRRRKSPAAESFPDAWLGTLGKNVSVYACLTDVEQAKLRTDLQIFVGKKYWEGCGGLPEVTDEMKVTIAAQACLLVLAMEHEYFRDVRSILLYPTAFRSDAQWVGPDGVVHQGRSDRAGEAVAHGPVVLAWDAVLAGGRNHQDGRNVVLHEFAHQLDCLDAWFDGVPPLRNREQYATWRAVMTTEYERLVRECEDGRATLLDEYGTTDATEFFAVATECFFEQPRPMRNRHPQLYQLLRDYYGQDPAERSTGTPR